MNKAAVLLSALAARLLLAAAPAAAERFRIAEVTYAIDGMTKQYAAELAVPVSTKRVFPTEAEFSAYLADLEQRFENERVFERIAIAAESAGAEDGVSLMRVHIQLKDSKHFIAVPYPKYDSNTGTTLKLKMKDANFFGTMQPLSFDVSYKHEKQEDGTYDDIAALTFDYRYPFRLWKLDTTWNNALELAFTLGSSSPEFNASTGLTFTLPFDSYKFVLDVAQKATRETDYEKYDDALFFTEYAQLSLPVTAADISGWGALIWTPFARYEYKWDTNGIDFTTMSYSFSVLIWYPAFVIYSSFILSSSKVLKF